jgi:uncharacterized membrane protein
MTATTAPGRPGSGLASADRGIAALMAVEAATLAVFAVLHISGVLRPGSGGSNRYGAGFAEAIICLVLVLGLRALARSPARGRLIALAATVFAILGFTVGLSFTVRGGAPIDLIYHATMFPVLIVTALLLGRRAGASALGRDRRSPPV